MHLIPLISLVLFALAQPGPSGGGGVRAAGRHGRGLRRQAGCRRRVLLSSGLPPSGERPLIGGVMWMTMPWPRSRSNAPCSAARRTDERRTVPDRASRRNRAEPGAFAGGPLGLPGGGRVASRRLPWAIPAPAEPVRLVLEKAAASGFRLLGPDGTPDAGARVVVTAFDAGRAR